MTEERYCYECKTPFDVDFVFVCRNNDNFSQAFTSSREAFDFAYESNLQFINLSIYQMYLVDSYCCEDKNQVILDHLNDLLIDNDDHQYIMTVEKIPLKWHKVY